MGRDSVYGYHVRCKSLPPQTMKGLKMFNEELALSYIEEGYTLTQVASKLGCSITRVNLFLQGKTIKIQKIQDKALSSYHSMLGARITERMVDKKYTLAGLSRLTGVSTAILKRAALGTQELTLTQLIKIATVFNTTPNSLLTPRKEYVEEENARKDA